MKIFLKHYFLNNLNTFFSEAEIWGGSVIIFRICYLLIYHVELIM